MLKKYQVDECAVTAFRGMRLAVVQSFMLVHFLRRQTGPQGAVE